MEASIKNAADLDKVAKERGLTVVESPLFLRDEPIGDLGAAPEIASRAFTMKDGEVTPAMRVSRGWVFATPAGKQDSYLPQLAEVADRVREDAISDKAAELLKSRAAAIAADLKKATDFAAAAKKAGFEVKTTELLARGGALPDIGANPDVDNAVFACRSAASPTPSPRRTGSVIARVAERADVTDAQIAEGRDALRDELANQRRDRFFSAYMAKAKTRLNIGIKQDVLAQVMGPMPASPMPSPPAGTRRPAVKRPHRDSSTLPRAHAASAASIAAAVSFQAASICGVGGRSAPSTRPKSCVA